MQDQRPQAASRWLWLALGATAGYVALALAGFAWQISLSIVVAGIAHQPCAAVWLGQQDLHLRLNGVDAVADFADVRRQLQIATAQCGGGGGKRGLVDQCR